MARERIQIPTREELMHPKPWPGWTCSICGSPSTFYPSPYVPDKKRPTVLVATGNGLLVCPHCTPLPKDKRPEWLHGELVKACGCGCADCPVARKAAS